MGGPLERDVGVCVLDSGGRVGFRDDTFERLIGLEVPVGAALCSLAPWLADVDPAQPGTFTSPDGGEVTVSPTSLAEAASAVCVCRPASAGDLERDLRTARRTLESILDAAPVSILALDLDRRVTMWNETATRMFGWTPDEVIGQPYPLVPREHEGSFAKLFGQVVAGQGFTGVEAQRRTKDGSRIDLRIHTAPFRDADGNVTGAMAILEDLTETRRLEEQIRHAQKMEAVGRLAGGIAHDFNNLLTVILGVSEVLGRDRGLSERMSEGLSQIAECGQSAQRLTQQLLAFGRRQVLHPEVADVGERVRQTAGMLERLIGEQIEMRLELANDSLPVEVDVSQFDQVLINLVVNACDAMKQGGRLWVRTTRDEVSAPGAPVPPGRYARLDVCDDGPGIPQEALPHVFDPFFTTKRPGHGTGLGLATVHGIVEQSGGVVRAESVEGEGTTFRVWLPLTDAAASDDEAGSPEPARVSGGGEPILLVEDDARVRDAVARMLGALGHPVETAEDGPTALDKLAAGVSADLIITDLAMPRMHGRALAHEARRMRPEVPIVYISADLDDPAVRSEVDAGRAAFLQKPISMGALAHTIAERLEGSKSRGDV